MDALIGLAILAGFLAFILLKDDKKNLNKLKGKFGKGKTSPDSKIEK